MIDSGNTNPKFYTIESEECLSDLINREKELNFTPIIGDKNDYPYIIRISTFDFNRTWDWMPFNQCNKYHPNYQRWGEERMVFRNKKWKFPKID